MSDYIYIIANLRNPKNIWMNTTPFVELKINNKIVLQMLRDISINFLQTENSIIDFSVYRIKGPIKNFLFKRNLIFENLNFLPDYAEQIGFEIVSDFNYIVDKINKTQIINGFKVSFNYTNDEIFGDNIYLTHPIITF